MLNGVTEWEADEMSWEPDSRHAEIVIEQTVPNGARALRIPGVKEEKQSDRDLRADIDNIIDENMDSDYILNISSAKHIALQ